MTYSLLTQAILWKFADEAQLAGESIRTVQYDNATVLATLTSNALVGD